MLVLILQYFFTAFAVLTLWLLFDVLGFEEHVFDGLWHTFASSRLERMLSMPMTFRVLWYLLFRFFVLIFANWIFAPGLPLFGTRMTYAA